MAAQRRQIQERITNSLLWQSTLYHWLGHGWNPRNSLPGTTQSLFTWQDESADGSSR